MKIKTRFNINDFEVNIRTCKLSDRNFILNLYRNTIFKQVAKYYVPSVKMFDERFYVDYKEKQILLSGKRRIGMFQLAEQKNKLIIKGLFLSKSYQGKGIAKHLMNYFEELAKANNYDAIELLVWDNNPAKDFYEKLAYKIDSKKNHKYLMIKTI